jgi:hypothetical protein
MPVKLKTAILESQQDEYQVMGEWDFYLSLP